MKFLGSKNSFVSDLEFGFLNHIYIILIVIRMIYQFNTKNTLIILTQHLLHNTFNEMIIKFYLYVETDDIDILYLHVNTIHTQETI